MAGDGKAREGLDLMERGAEAAGGNLGGTAAGFALEVMVMVAGITAHKAHHLICP